METTVHSYTANRMPLRRPSQTILTGYCENGNEAAQATHIELGENGGTKSKSDFRWVHKVPYRKGLVP